MGDDEFRRAAREIEARTTLAFDQELAEVKAMYDGFAPEQREQFKSFIVKASELATEVDYLPAHISLHINVSETAYDQQGKCLYDGHASLTPRVILKAIEAWERGEEFTPKAFGTF